MGRNNTLGIGTCVGVTVVKTLRTALVKFKVQIGYSNMDSKRILNFLRGIVCLIVKCFDSYPLSKILNAKK